MYLVEQYGLAKAAFELAGSKPVVKQVQLSLPAAIHSRDGLQEKWASLLLQPVVALGFQPDMENFLARHMESLQGLPATVGKPVFDWMATTIDQFRASQAPGLVSDTYAAEFNTSSDPAVITTGRPRNDNAAISYNVPAFNGPAFN